MVRGRKPGQGKFSGGRPKDAPNKKGSFEASLPPVRCKQALYNKVEIIATQEGKSISTWLREYLEKQLTDGEQSHEADFQGAGDVSCHS